MRVGIVGAGLSGAVIARSLAEAGLPSLVIEERPHPGGNSHTARDAQTGIMVHTYGPHIFHTSIERVWTFVNRFATMEPYVNRVKAQVLGRIYSLPINLLTINQFFGTTFSPAEARAFIESQARRDIAEPRNFEEQALATIGEALYEAFFRGYTRKQWGMEPAELPAAILKRLPLRFNYEDNYYTHRWQAIPREGYTAMVSAMLAHPLIELRTGCRHEDVDERFVHLFYSGPLDRYFHHDAGRLGYRTLHFEEIRSHDDYQGTAVINYPDERVPFTRIVEYKHFAPWEADSFPETIAFREYSAACSKADTPYYPIRLAAETRLLAQYEERARLEADVTFIGRLGTYCYLDMDVTIEKALRAADQFLAHERTARNACGFRPVTSK